MDFLNTLFFNYIKLIGKTIVKVPSWITVIPSGAFENMRNLQEVQFCGEIDEIQRNAFCGCTHLRKVKFWKKANHISVKAFDNADAIVFYYSKNIPDSDLQKMRRELGKKKKVKIAEKVESEPETAKNISAEEITVPEETEVSEILSETAEKTENEAVEEITVLEETEASEMLSETVGETENEAAEEIIIPEETEVTENVPEPVEEPTAEEKSVIQPTAESFGEIVIEEKIKTERKTSPQKRSRTLVNTAKEELRKIDREKYAKANSITSIKSGNSLISKLIDRYALLRNKYGESFPLGLIDVSKEEFSAAALIVKQYIEGKAAITSLTGFVSSIFLVKTVENYSMNGDFWKSVASLLKCSETEATVFLKKALLAFCSSENLYFHYYDGRRSYRGTVLIHAVIGEDELDNTMGILKNFYIEEMCESYSNETAPAHISHLTDIMAKDLESDVSGSDEISGLYHVSFNFKNACREFPEAMMDILKCLLFNINAYYHRLSDTSYSPPVFYKYFNRWYISDILHSRKKTEIKKSSHTSAPERKNARQIEKLGSDNKCSYFIDENNTLFLYVPKIEIPSELAYGNIVTALYDGENLIPNHNIENEVVGMFRFHTSEQVIQLEKFYKNLIVKVETDDGEVIFDSRSQLIRKYLTFDTALTEFAPKTIPDERFYVLAESDSEFFADYNYNSYSKSNYTLYSLDVEKECNITVDSQQIFRSISENSDASLSADRKYRCKNVRVMVNGAEYSVYLKMPEIRVNISENASDDYIIDLNEIHIDVSSLAEKSIDISSYTNSRYVTVSLRKKGSLHCISEYSIAVFEGFEYTLDKEYYYDENTAELLDIYADDIDFDIQDFPYQFAITRSREIIVNAFDNGTELSFVLKLPVIYWEINEKYNSLSGTKYISSAWIREEKFLKTDVPVNDVQIFAVNDKMNRSLVVSNRKTDISDFHNSVSDYTTFGMSVNHIGQLKMFEIIYTSALRDVSVICNGEQLIVSLFCIGKCPLQIVIKDNSGNQVLSKSYSAFDEGEVTFSETLSELADGIFDIELYRLKADAFGFSTAKISEGTYRIVKGSPFEVYISEHRNELKPEFCYFDGDEKKRVQNFYCENLHKPDAESEIYSADAFFYNRYGDKIYLKNANPLRIELLEKKDNLLTFTMTDCDNDGFLYEKARGYLVSDNAGLRDYNSYSLPDHYAIKI